MIVFVDTSAFYALLDSSDRRHREAARIWAGLLDSGADLETHNYVIVETAALVERRLGEASYGAFFDGLLGVVRVVWVDEDAHRRAEGAMRAASKSGLSLVDCVSFEVIRRRAVETAFAFDHHFEENGFTILKS